MKLCGAKGPVRKMDLARPAPTDRTQRQFGNRARPGEGGWGGGGGGGVVEAKPAILLLNATLEYKHGRGCL